MYVDFDTYMDICIGSEEEACSVWPTCAAFLRDNKAIVQYWNDQTNIARLPGTRPTFAASRQTADSVQPSHIIQSSWSSADYAVPLAATEVECQSGFVFVDGGHHACEKPLELQSGQHVPATMADGPPPKGRPWGSP